MGHHKLLLLALTYVGVYMEDKFRHYQSYWSTGSPYWWRLTTIGKSTESWKLRPKAEGDVDFAYAYMPPGLIRSKPGDAFTWAYTPLYRRQLCLG